jgi:hypothetical protein
MKLHECIFLGYGEIEGRKAYWLYDKTKQKCNFRKNVVFNEQAMC